MEIKVTDLVKQFGSLTAVDEISFTAEDGELTCLLGPSGCGKTTTLRCVAGLERPNAGEIRIGDQVVTSPAEDVFVPPNKRDIGFVFQTFDVWPHLNVFDNVAYPLSNQDYDADEIEELVVDALELTGIDHLRTKPSTQLSGGQQARVGICRAIVSRPSVLLFDEPLTGLDRNLRQKLRYEIKRIQSELGITSIYVTHSQPEAMTLADKILLMNTDGQVEQEGSAQDIYYSPTSLFSFEFFGASENIDVQSVDNGVIESEIGHITITREVDTTNPNSLIAGFRPEHVELTLSEEADWSDNVWRGQVMDINFLGNEFEVLVSAGGRMIRSRHRTLPDGLEQDQPVRFHVAPENVFVYSAE